MKIRRGGAKKIPPHKEEGREEAAPVAPKMRPLPNDALRHFVIHGVDLVYCFGPVCCPKLL